MPLMTDTKNELKAISMAALDALSMANDFPDMQAKPIDGNSPCQKISRKHWCCQEDAGVFKLIRKSQASPDKAIYALRHSYIINQTPTGRIDILRMTRAFRSKFGEPEKSFAERLSLVHEGEIEAIGSGSFGLVKSVIKQSQNEGDSAQHTSAIMDESVVVKIMGERITEPMRNPSRRTRGELESMAAYTGADESKLGRAARAQKLLNQLNDRGHDISDDGQYIIDKETRTLITHERVLSGECNEEALKTAEREVMALKKTGQFIGAMIQDQKIYILMKRVPGQPANYHPKDFSKDADPAHQQIASSIDFLNYMQRVIMAVKQFHEQTGLAHNDLKPTNMLDDGQAVHLIDFGAAKPLTERVDQFYQGTARYMPTIGSGTPRSDYYALGQIFLDEYPAKLATLTTEKDIDEIIADLKSGDSDRQNLSLILKKIEHLISQAEQELVTDVSAVYAPY